MNEQLITKEVAELAKQAGFDWNTGANCWIKTLDGRIIHNSERTENPLDNRFTLYLRHPTQTILSKWLREVHKIYIELIIDGWGTDELVSKEYLCYRAFIWEVGKPRPLPQADLGAANYEKILESALESALQIVIDKNKI